MIATETLFKNKQDSPPDFTVGAVHSDNRINDDDNISAREFFDVLAVDSADAAAHENIARNSITAVVMTAATETDAHANMDDGNDMYNMDDEGGLNNTDKMEDMDDFDSFDEYKDSETKRHDAESAEMATDSVKQYLKEIGEKPLLTEEEEYSLGMMVKYGSPEEHKYAVNKLTEHNLRYVVSIARKHVSSGIPIMDLIQDGNLGLLRAANLYDPEKGFRFSTYATWWIRQSMSRGIDDKGRLIRIPVHKMEDIRIVNRAISEAEKEGGDVSADAIAKRTGMTKSQVEEVLFLSQKTISLDMPVGEDEESTISEFIPDKNFCDPEAEALNMDMKCCIEEAMQCLAPRERHVLERRFGLDGGRSRTLEEVGNEMGVTRERIRQIEAKALRKLRNPKRSSKLKQYLSV